MSARTRVAALATVAVLVAGACTSTTSPTPAASTSAKPSATTPTYTGLLGQIQKDGKVTIGTSNDAPLSYVDSTTNKASGVLTDILVEFFSRQGLSPTVDMISMQFGSLIPAVQSGQIEIIGDAMYVRPARAEIIDFSMTTFYNPEGLDVVKGNPKSIHQLADLCGKSAGSYIGTTYIDQLTAQNAKCAAGSKIDIKTYPKIEDVFNDLSAGRIDAAVVDASLSGYALKQNSSLAFELVGDYIPESKSTNNCAFGIAKGNQAFLDAFNKTYAEMLADGTAAKLFTKWGLTPTDFFLKA